jgi:hypothetical protein
MKKKLLITLCTFVLAMSGIQNSRAQGNTAEAITDVVIVRPLCLVATVIGTAFFVVSLPVAIPSKSVKETAQTLVVRPAQATFTRPIGDFKDMPD